MTDDHLPTRTEGEGETLDMPEGMGGFAPGQVLGERYQILEMLGRGGMGEVWQAFDLKLRVEVALKALRPEFFKSERRLELLRQEVRAAREVMSPNVCRIFDLIEIEGRELVSMEYVDGATLLGVLQERGPLELKEAQDIASQFLAGLEAIHKVGLIHRDIKPENIMLTRAGRVIVMDFGLARQEVEGGGSVSGTPAYMAPEQAAGQQLDARADVYAAGVVLAEMVSPDGIKSYDSRQSVWEGVRSEPAKLPDSPWAPVLKRAVAKDREGRFNTARTLTRALEDVTLRVEGAEDLHPYPGLASFTESDAEYFFGREAEVEQMWRKLDGPPRMLAVAGPSGAGKTSFLGAGLAPHAPPGWGIVRCTPGDAPVNALAGAFASETAGDPDGVKLLLRFHEPEVAVDLVARWSRKHGHALLIIDQFEELFTLNPPEIQRTIAELLNALVLEADIVVLLSMRDDYLFRCHQNEPLRPALADLTMLGPPEGAPLRRALTQPALQCGYRFEDDELVDEMLAEVEGERGALPLLAFAAARLWEKRDRGTGLLTRQAYQDIGGVGGALARHAEATIDRIGMERIPVVRELFRNLVTAEGTRAVREWSELLSVFYTGDVSREGINPSPTKGGATARGIDPSPTKEMETAEEILHTLIDARLLTSYEVREDEHEPIRRVEIIHESLLANWPRLVRWQTQDQEGAQLRDELRQSARAWDEHGRHDDRLWTGTAYREFLLWHERYPGGLTEIEEAFASSMTKLATRRKRRRRLATIAAVTAIVIVATVFAGLWRRSVAETRRAEAQKLIALGQVRLEDYPTAALANATSSLELADSDEARFLALQALWEGPTAFVVNETPSLYTSFSPDGEWLVQSHHVSSSIAVISRTGGQRVLDHPTESGTTWVWGRFRLDEDLFLSFGHDSDLGRFALWSAPEGRLLATAKPIEDPQMIWGHVMASHDGIPKALLMVGKGDLVTIEALNADGSHERLGEYRLSTPVTESQGCIPLNGEWFAIQDGDEIYVVDISAEGLSEPRLLGRDDDESVGWRADPLGRFFLTFAKNGRVRRWSPSGDLPPTDYRVLVGTVPAQLSIDGGFLSFVRAREDRSGGINVWRLDDSGLNLLRGFDGLRFEYPAFDWVGLRLAMRGPLPAFRLWSLTKPAAAKPLVLRGGPAGYSHQPMFSPDGRWLATNDYSGLKMWPLARTSPAVIDIDFKPWSNGLAFGPDGRFLVTSAGSEVRSWPLEGPVPPPDHIIFATKGGSNRDAAISPNGELFAVGGNSGAVWIGRDGEEPQKLLGAEDLLPDSGWITFSPDGRLVAAADGGYDIANATIYVWNVATREEIAVFRPDEGELRGILGFPGDGRLLVGTTAGVVAWNVETDDREVLIEYWVQHSAASHDGLRLLVTEGGENEGLEVPVGCPSFFDLGTGEVTTLQTHGLHVRAMALGREGTIAVTGDADGLIRVGPVTGEEPHLLLGHEKQILQLAIDPLGRWIASASMDGTMRLWPMPDLSKPPLHTLPREELIAKLKTLTNLRVVRDPDSPTGWKLTHDPFPGWETVPTW